MKLRIGLFNDSFPPLIDGVSNVVASYADIIHKEYGESIVVTPKYKGVVDDYPYEVVRYESVPLQKKYSYRAGNPFNMRTIKQLRNKNMDLIHVHCPLASSVLAQLVVKDRNIPVVMTYHTKFDVDFEERINLKLFRQIAIEFVVANMNTADEVWVVSQGAGEALKDIGFSGEYLVMENGTDFKKGLATPEKIAEFNLQKNISSDELVFLFVGRMMWYKNVRLILDSLKILSEKEIQFKAYFVGDGHELDSIKEYSQNLKLEQVEFTGSISDREELRVYYSRADLFIFPSTFDTSGLVVKEAAACNCPSILVKGSCAAEGVEDGLTGFLCEETAQSCAEAIEGAIRDRGNLKQVGINAGENIYLSWEDAVKKAYNRYEEIVVKTRLSPRKKKIDILLNTFRAVFKKSKEEKQKKKNAKQNKK